MNVTCTVCTVMSQQCQWRIMPRQGRPYQTYARPYQTYARPYQLTELLALFLYMLVSCILTCTG